MSPQRINYDKIAPEYDRRYEGELQERGKALLKLASRLQAERILEVGCGTGHWLASLRSTGAHLYGLDLSEGMLRQAQGRAASLFLVRGTATELPFSRDWFDLVFCVDAVHHFGEPRAFIAQVCRILRPGGALAVLGSDPRHDRWYAYDYFDTLYATDLARFPPREALAGWMSTEGFGRAELQLVERIQNLHYGRDVLDDPFLGKNSCSQLALLSDDTYQAGLTKISNALRVAESRGETLTFCTQLIIHMLVGRKLAEPASVHPIFE